MEVQWKCSETTVNCTSPALVHCNTQQGITGRERTGKSCNHYRIFPITLQINTVALQWKPGPPRQIFAGKTASGGHIRSTPPLPLPCSVSLNPGKILVLAVLSPVAALGTTCKNCKPEIQWFTVPCTNICHTQHNAEL